MKLLLTCGGTAGHVYPAVALARVFQSREPRCEVLFVGADGGMELELLEKEGYPVRTVTISNFRRSLSPRNLGHNLRSLWNVVASRRQAAQILREFRPDLVVGTGGYASFPCVRQAARMGIPTAIHESNATPGLTTRTLARQVNLVMVGFQEAVSHYEDPARVKVTGTPVRPDFFALTREQARARLGLSNDRPLVLSFWGSLGASAMNRQMVDFLARRHGEDRPFHHIHGAGRDFDSMSAALEERGLAGAVLVPSPNVTANHQFKNAQVLAERGGAVLVEEKACSGEALYRAVRELLADGIRRERMERAQRTLAVPTAAEDICDALSKLLR